MRIELGPDEKGFLKLFVLRFGLKYQIIIPYDWYWIGMAFKSPEVTERNLRNIPIGCLELR